VVPLLDLITRESLDEDYRHVADRRRGEAAPASRTRSALTVVAVLVFGLIVTIAGVQTSRNASVATASKDELIARIHARRSEVASLQRQIAAVRAAATSEDATYGDLGHSLNAASAQRKSLLASTGWAPVHGDGIKARIDDAPSGNAQGQVRDSDLAGLVNGLWQAGATAISVNGQRVTALSAMRNTASAVRINNVSLSPPYTVLALGDTRTMQANFARSTSGSRLWSLTAQFGMPFSMQAEKNLTLPAAPTSMLVLRHTRTDKTGPKNQEDKP
jgi:uncharacterized protein YlxW (UPF0749 family)